MSNNAMVLISLWYYLQKAIAADVSDDEELVLSYCALIKYIISYQILTAPIRYGGPFISWFNIFRKFRRLAK